ncbi:MAG: putative inner membrane protein [Methanocella sp. PtaU1.Bin125]|nr:MAG: putative inner membrane protein [Methanocella sp. PtaU1.Bin125]
MNSEGVLAALIGFFFGFALQRAGASDYGRLHGMLGLRDLGLLKLMMTSIGVAAVGIYAFAAQGVRHFTIKPLKVLAMTVGGFMFGKGFAMCGYCPGTGIVGMMEGKPDALLAVIGGLLGSLAYAYAKPSIDRALDKPDYGELTVSSVAKTDPLVTAIVYGIAMVLAAFMIDRIGQALRR